MCLQLQLVILVVVVHPSGVQKAHLLSEFNKTELMSFGALERHAGHGARKRQLSRQCDGL